VTHYSWEICADPAQRRLCVEVELGLQRGVMASEEAP
jgi:hypothetical protein